MVTERQRHHSPPLAVAGCRFGSKAATCLADCALAAVTFRATRAFMSAFSVATGAPSYSICRPVTRRLRCGPSSQHDRRAQRCPRCAGPTSRADRQRFIYLSWGTIEAPATFIAFGAQRAKPFRADGEPDITAAAERSGRLVARLGLTDSKGHPVCARLRSPAAWGLPGEPAGSPSEKARLQSISRRPYRAGSSASPSPAYPR